MSNQKKILFIISNLETGGVSKSLTSLMNTIDRRRYDVSLMILSSQGPFMDLLPNDLRIITNPVWAEVSSRFDGVTKLIRRGRFDLAIGSCLRMMMSRFDRAKAGIMIAKMMPALKEEFDTVVDFNGQHQLYFMVDKIKARKKVTFFHSDYAKWDFYYKADKKYFNGVDAIFTVSDQCVGSLKRYFPEQSDKIGIMENISNPSLIARMAEEPSNEMKQGMVSLLTIGHLTDLKGTPLAIKAARILKDKGIDFKWYFLGANRGEGAYEKMIDELGLNNEIVFLGTRINPYPYIRRATIVVHPSIFEGRSIALDEVKILAKPVVVTNFSTVGDQFTDGVNASIVDMTPEAIADGISDLITDKDKRTRYSHYLKENIRDNSSEIEKLYRIFDS